MDRPDARMLIFDLHRKDGAGPVSKLPGLWFRRIDDNWSIWVNGHRTALLTGTGVHVNPGDCHVEYGDWPAGSFGMIDGEGILAAGAAANYETFCAALQQAIDAA